MREGTLNRNNSSSPSCGGNEWYYGLLLPAAFIYTIVIRELAGPSFSDAPNQGAMLTFGLLVVVWPIFAIFLSWVIKFVFSIPNRGRTSVVIAFWLASCFIPFVIGMK